LYDSDSVEEHNQPASFYLQDQIGMPKVEAVASNIMMLNGIDVVAHDENYSGQPIDTPLVVIALDTARGRMDVWRQLRRSSVPPVEFIVDVASGMNMIRIEPFTPDEEDRYLDGFNQEEAPLPCSGRSVAYNSFVAAGLVAAILKCYTFQQPYPDLIEIDMASWYYNFRTDYDKFLDNTT